MDRPPLRATQAALLCGMWAASAFAQGKPMSRVFTAKAVEKYEIQLMLRAEIRGASTETVGEKTYVKPAVHSAQLALAWTSQRRVLEVLSDGSASIEESEAPVPSGCAVAPVADPGTRKLQESLQEICSRLRGMRTFRYEEEPNGLIRNLPAESGVTFDEDAPFLLALWLRRNLRPSVIFPALPFRAGAGSQRPIHTRDMTGCETTEWMDSTGNASAAALHVVQQLSWPEPRGKSGFSSVGGTPPGETTFFADSSTSVSLLDGAVLNATRTASRETTRVLDPVPGLPRRPQFSSKLTVIVTVRRIS